MEILPTWARHSWPSPDYEAWPTAESLLVEEIGVWLYLTPVNYKFAITLEYIRKLENPKFIFLPDPRRRPRHPPRLPSPIPIRPHQTPPNSPKRFPSISSLSHSKPPISLSKPWSDLKFEIWISQIPPLEQPRLHYHHRWVTSLPLCAILIKFDYTIANSIVFL